MSGRKWIKILTRRITPQILPIVTSPKYYFFDSVGTGFRDQLYVPRGKKHDFYFNGPEWQKFGERVVEKIKTEKGFISKHTKACVASCEKLIKWTDICRKEKITKWPNKELKNWYNKYLKLFEEYYLFMWTPHIIEDYLENVLRSELSKELKKRGEEKQFDDIIGIVTTKTKLNLAEKEEIELLKIATKIDGASNSKEKIDSVLKRHAENWGWLPFYSLDMELWTRDYFADRAQKIENPKEELEGRLEKNRLHNDNLLKTKELFRDNKELLEVIDLTQDYLFLRTDRTDTLRIVLWNIKPFLEEVAKKIDVGYKEIIYSTPNEVLTFLEKGVKPSKDELNKRRHRFIIFTTIDKSIDIVSDEKAIQAILRRELGKDRSEKGKDIVLNGTGVFPGVIRGRVKIIENQEDWDKMEKGSILVTTMTTPEMVIVYKKAKAIVTDEGGMTCHAAIVSRELQIPCVIGTGEATTLLEDGMCVEVDSRKGVVTLVESLDE